MKGFEVYEYDIDENKKIIIINIEEISTELEEEINRYITEIWEGYTDGDISDVKKEILKYLGEEYVPIFKRNPAHHRRNRFLR